MARLLHSTALGIAALRADHFAQCAVLNTSDVVRLGVLIVALPVVDALLLETLLRELLEKGPSFVLLFAVELALLFSYSCGQGCAPPARKHTRGHAPAHACTHTTQRNAHRRTNRPVRPPIDRSPKDAATGKGTP